jgi:hypothetical protein
LQLHIIMIGVTLSPGNGSSILKTCLVITNPLASLQNGLDQACLMCGGDLNICHMSQGSGMNGVGSVPGSPMVSFITSAIAAVDSV